MRIFIHPSLFAAKDFLSAEELLQSLLKIQRHAETIGNNL